MLCYRRKSGSSPGTVIEDERYDIRNVIWGLNVTVLPRSEREGVSSSKILKPGDLPVKLTLLFLGDGSRGIDDWKLSEVELYAEWYRAFFMPVR